MRRVADWKREAFDEERKSRLPDVRPHFIKRIDGWILFGPQDVRNRNLRYHFALQMLNCDKVVRVRAGCRFYTIEKAFEHWAQRRYNGVLRNNFCRQACAIISLMISQAQSYGLMPMFTAPRGKRPVITTIKLEPKRKKK